MKHARQVRLVRWCCRDKLRSGASKRTGGGHLSLVRFKRRLSRVVVEMGFEELFVRFWWLIFPLFGMFMGFWAMIQGDRRSRRAMDTIKTYVEQGKEPPAELLDIAAGDHPRGGTGQSFRRRSPGWSTVVYTALAVAALLGSRMMHDKDAGNWMLIGAVFFGILALGSFFMLMSAPRPDK